MLIKDVREFMGWLDGSLVNLRRHTKKQQDLQEPTDNPNQFEVTFETGFGSDSDWHGGNPALEDSEDEMPVEPNPYKLGLDKLSRGDPGLEDSKDEKLVEPIPYKPSLDKLSEGRLLNYDPFPTEIEKIEFYNGEEGYPKPPVEASGWLQYWKSVRQILLVDQYRLWDGHPKYSVHQLLLPERSLKSQSKAAKYTRLWGNRILGEITFEIIKYDAVFAISGTRIINLAKIKAEVAQRILNPPEAIKQRHRDSS